MKKKIITLPTVTAFRLSISICELIDMIREYELYEVAEYHIKLNSFISVMNKLDDQVNKSTIKVSLTPDQLKFLNDSTTQLIEKKSNLTKSQRTELNRIKIQLCDYYLMDEQKTNINELAE